MFLPLSSTHLHIQCDVSTDLAVSTILIMAVWTLAQSLLLAAVAHALDNGFGRTPIMGFNTYNDVGCSPNQSHVQNTINSFASKGFGTVGYKYFQVDCGWQGYQRQSNGSITYDAGVFPDGIAPLSKLAISKGFQWGMYTDQGVYSCDTKTPLRTGSLNHEKEDALMFAAWNTAYIKVLSDCKIHLCCVSSDAGYRLTTATLMAEAQSRMHPKTHVPTFRHDIKSSLPRSRMLVSRGY